MRQIMRLCRTFAPWMTLALALLCSHATALADTASASVSVTITDSSGAIVPDAHVAIRNIETDQRQELSSNKTGSVTFSFLKPGHYKLTVSKTSFADVVIDNLVLNVGDERRLHLTLKVGSAEQTVNVDGSGPTINTTDASVSTVIDRKFVENTPLNGRSFQSLILLSPGVVTNSPQSPSSLGSSGEFSVNGQRTESNYYSVDGVSANAGVYLAPNGTGPSGSLPMSSALGTTQALVSVDALQEFRVESSTYSAEFGRNPGGQFSMITRSGTNDWHGTLFDYFRNDALDANNWFNDHVGSRKSAEHQNDFGGTFGGPIVIRPLYDGHNRTFFFFSYEGVRLLQPVAATINQVPNLAMRASSTGALKQALDGFPLPTPGAPDLGNGLGEFISGWSNPSREDAFSLRLDHQLPREQRVFLRLSNTPSNVQSRGTADGYSTPSNVSKQAYTSRTLTLGISGLLKPALGNDFRANVSTNMNAATSYVDGFGGAKAVDLNTLQGFPSNSYTSVSFYIGAYEPAVTTESLSANQRQWNLVDTVSLTHGDHTFKFGIDWRRSSPAIRAPYKSANYEYDSAKSVALNAVDFGNGSSRIAMYPLYHNLSVFAQDEWRVQKRLSLSLGLRWDVNPSPTVTRGMMPFTALGLSNLSTLTLAPQGTRLWDTSWYNFAPRVGAAYTINPNPSRLSVLRAGAGVFYDTGQQLGSYAFNGPGFQSTVNFGTSYGTPASFPSAPSLAAPPLVEPPSAPYSLAYASSRRLQLPYTYQWNVSVEQALGSTQSITLSYVGSNGRKLLQEQQYSISAINPSFGTLVVFTNGLSSSYNSLQLKAQRQVAKGLQALASYSWSHSLDYGSYNSAFAYQRGNSDFDVRNNFTAALSYEVYQGKPRAKALRAITQGWGTDLRIVARSGFPVTFKGRGAYDPSSHQYSYAGLSRVPGVPLFLYGPASRYPGGRSVNPAAFCFPTTCKLPVAPRNFVDGFGAVQADLAIRKNIAIKDRMAAQFRAEAFNLANHPIFGTVNSTLGNAQFGQATSTLSQSLGVLSPLYQMGGPRSLQLSLKLTF